jgi:hypothetical protein
MSAVGFVWLAVFHGASGLPGFLPGLILVGGGVAIASVPFGSLILAEAPPEHLGPVSSSLLTFGQIFYTVGLATSTVVIDRMTTGGVVHRLEHAGVPASQIGTGMDAVTTFAAKGTTPTTSWPSPSSPTARVLPLPTPSWSPRRAEAPGPVLEGRRRTSRATDQKAQDRTCV